MGRGSRSKLIKKQLTSRTRDYVCKRPQFSTQNIRTPSTRSVRSLSTKHSRPPEPKRRITLFKTISAASVVAVNVAETARSLFGHWWRRGKRGRATTPPCAACKESISGGGGDGSKRLRGKKCVKAETSLSSFECMQTVLFCRWNTTSR